MNRMRVPLPTLFQLQPGRAKDTSEDGIRTQKTVLQVVTHQPDSLVKDKMTAAGKKFFSLDSLHASADGKSRNCRSPLLGKILSDDDKIWIIETRTILSYSHAFKEFSQTSGVRMHGVSRRFLANLVDS